MNAEITKLFSALSAVATQVLKKRLVFISGDRTCQRQLEISGADSFHTVGEAFDAKLSPYDPAEQAYLGSLAESRGFRWGGNFRGNFDPNHFDNGRRARSGHCP